MAITSKITGFQKNQHGDWVAELDCGHMRHMRHRPPWQVRRWVVSTEGRAHRVGSPLRCNQCR